MRNAQVIRSNKGKACFMATVIPGIEDIAVTEMAERFSGVEILEKARGKVFFRFPSKFRPLFETKCVDNIYLHLGRFSIGPHKADLLELSKKIGKMNIMGQMSRVLQMSLVRKKITVSASRSGKHTYSRFDAAEMAKAALLEHFPFCAGTKDNHDFAFRLDIQGETADLHLQLTSASFKFRGREKKFLIGALRPSVAHAMVLLSKPELDDVFLDPFCGSGTIPFERAFYDSYAILASDISEERLKVARKNLPAFVGINCWDACQTELPDNSVTKIVSNLPWGRQIRVADMKALYTGFLKEAKRILTFHGRLVLLTDQQDVLEDAALMNKFLVRRITTISLHGLHPSIFLVEKSC